MESYKRTFPPKIWRKDRQVTIQEWTESSTTARGQSSGTWGNLATTLTVWASIEPLTARTAEYARQLYTAATHRVFIDYRSDVVKEMRLQYGTRYFYIGYARNVDEADTLLELLVMEGDP